MSSWRKTLVTITLATCGLILLWPRHGEVKEIPKEAPVVESGKLFYQRMGVKAVASGLDWELGAYLIAVRDDAARIPGVNGTLAWRELTEAYVRDLARRRDAVIDWTRSGEHPPLRVTFIGVIHKDVDNSPEQQDVTVRSQAAVLSIVRERSSRTGVITIESAGAHQGPLTWDAYVAFGADALFRYQGVWVDPDRLESLLLADAPKDADVTMLRTDGLPPIIYGEELVLYQTHHWLITLAAAGEIPTTDAAELFNGLLKRLRSEIAVIRALEFLRKNGGSEAIITHGYAHGDDYERFVDDYDVVFERTVPVRPLQKYR